MKARKLQILVQAMSEALERVLHRMQLQQPSPPPRRAVALVGYFDGVIELAQCVTMPANIVGHEICFDVVRTGTARVRVTQMGEIPVVIADLRHGANTLAFGGLVEFIFEIKDLGCPRLFVHLRALSD